MASIHFTITAEDKNLQKVLRDIEKGVSNTSKAVKESGDDMDKIISKITKGAAALGLAFSGQQLVSNIAKVRGEFQQLEVAFNTMLGSQEKSTALMSQLTKTAAITPFGLQDVAGGAKQLLAYGVAAEDVNETLIRLGDIAAGLSIPLGDLVYLYGTTMTQGRMFTQDLRQFQGRGIPLADELAKQFGVTKDKVGELVTAGKVGFEEMNQAIISLTSEGGKFGGLMEAQSKTIVGQISNLEDAVDVMFNEIGKSQEGIINTSLSVASKLVENYEAVGNILISLVATYGAYKAALMLTVAAEKVAIAQRLASIKGLNILQATYALLTKKVAAFNAVSMANPFVLAATAVAALVSGAVLLGKAMDKNGDAQNRLNKAMEDYNNLLNKTEASAKSAISAITDESSTQSDKVKAYNELKRIIPEITSQYKLEELAVLDIVEANKLLAQWRETADKKARQQQITELKAIASQKYESIRSRQLLGRKVDENEIKAYRELRKEIESLEQLDKDIDTANQAAATATKTKEEEEALKRLLKEREKLVKEAQKSFEELIRQNEDREIELMEAGYEKELAVVRLAYQRRKAEIDNLEKQFRDSNGGTLTGDQAYEIGVAREINEKERVKGETQALKNKNKEIENLLKEYQSLTDKYVETSRKFEEDRLKLESAGASQNTLDELDYKENETLNAISLEMIQREATFKSWMDSVSAMSLDQLRKTLVFAKQELQLLESQNPNSEKTIQARGKVSALEDQLKSFDKNSDKVEKSDDDWKELYETLNDVAGQFDEIGELVGGTAGEIMSLAGNVATGVISMIDGVKAVGKTGAEALSTVEKASVILAIIGTAIKLVTKIVNLASELHDKKHENRIKKLQEQVDILEKGYDKLGEAVENAFSKDASRLIEQQNTLLKQQKALIQQQIKEEEDKKKTDKDRIEDWKQQIEDINKTLEENKQKAIDAIFGEDLQSAIESFADAYAEAVSSGEDKWTSVKDTVKDMMRQMVVESIKSALQSSKAIENIRKKLQEFYTDGVLSATEQDYIYKMAENVQRELDRQFGWANNLLGESSATGEQKATSGGFETMSEATGSELNGRFTALQMAGEEIRVQMISAVNALYSLVTGSSEGNSLLADILTQHAITNAYLEDIVKYSKIMSGYGAKLDKIVEQTKNL